MFDSLADSSYRCKKFWCYALMGFFKSFERNPEGLCGDIRVINAFGVIQYRSKSFSLYVFTDFFNDLSW
jgi:hypothetical protein